MCTTSLSVAWLRKRVQLWESGEEQQQAPLQSPELNLMFCCLRVKTSCSSELPMFCKTAKVQFLLRFAYTPRKMQRRCDWPPAAPSARWSASRCGCLHLRTPPSARLCWGKRVGPRWGSPNIQPPCKANVSNSSLSRAAARSRISCMLSLVTDVSADTQLRLAGAFGSLLDILVRK